MADVRPIKKGTSTQFSEMGGSDTIPASLIGIVPKFETPSGSVNGSNTAFTLSSTPVANASVIMVLDGVTQTNGTDYTVSGTTVTFTTAPTTGTEVIAIYNSAASAGGATSQAIRVVQSIARLSCFLAQAEKQENDQPGPEFRN